MMMTSFRHPGESDDPLPRATLWVLAGRAIIALGGVRSAPADRAWVKSVLTPAELDLWTRLPAYDQNHAVRVARRAQRKLSSTGYGADTVWLGAALMHDVGKLQSNLS